MKRPEDWDEQVLLEMIRSKYEESIELEFKEARALGREDGKKFDISKDVSSFANSAGGIILYGMEESASSNHCAGALSPIDSTEFPKEWLEQIVNSRIHPRIDGLIVNPIELRSQSPGNVAYAVVIPESTTVHQASDLRYYKRFNFESRPMEDYEVRLSMNRASRPAYSIQLQAGGPQGRPDAQIYRFRILVQNESEIVGHEVAAVLFVPQGLIGRRGDRTYDMDGVPYSRISGTYHETHAVIKSAVTSAHPLTTYHLLFDEDILVRVHPVYLRPDFQAIVWLYDQYGLALRASFKVSVPEMRVELLGESHGRRRPPMRLEP